MAGRRLILDLDDTLYDELDYCESGYFFIANLCSELYGVEREVIYKGLIKTNRTKEFDWLVKFLNLPSSCIEEFVWLYRLHKPNIGLSNETRGFLIWADEFFDSVSVLTNGRSLTQRLKLLQLGIINRYKICISGETGLPKPDRRAFINSCGDSEGDKCFYLGDNPKIDFFTPRQLGWIVIGLKGGTKNIHQQCLSNQELQPSYWVKSFSEARAVIERSFL